MSKLIILSIMALALASCGGGGSGGSKSPDLIISSSSSLGLLTTSLTVNTTYKMQFTITNGGDKTARSGFFVLVQQIGGSAAYSEFPITNDIAPGESWLYELDFVPEAGDIGNISARLTVDSKNSVKEKSEANNTFTSGLFSVSATVKAPVGYN